MPGAREGEVKTAMGSVIYYERWRQEKDDSLLKQIADYNEDDCRSTYLLREWLLSCRPSEIDWFKSNEDKSEKKGEETLTEAEKELIYYREKLIDPLPEDRDEWGEEQGLAGDVTRRVVVGRPATFCKKDPEFLLTTLKSVVDSCSAYAQLLGAHLGA